jgi:UPF0716 protein FxsA
MVQATPVPLNVLFFALLLFIAIEIAAFALVAGQLGFLAALVLLIIVSALGPAVVRRVGTGVLAHTRERLGRGEAPTREVLDGIVVLMGGVLICVPGFVGDALGLSLMIGPVRHFVIRAFGHRLSGRVQSFRGSGRVVDVTARAVHDRAQPPTRPPLPSGPDYST